MATLSAILRRSLAASFRRVFCAFRQMGDRDSFNGSDKYLLAVGAVLFLSKS